MKYKSLLILQPDFYSSDSIYLFQVLDDSFAKAAPQYEAPRRKKRNSKQEKKEKQKASRPMSTNSGRGLIMALSPSVASSVGPIGPNLKMKPNPGMAMALAQTGPPPDIEVRSAVLLV